MASNIRRYLNEKFKLSVPVSHPAAPDSGDPVRFGSLTGIALTDEGDGGNAAADTTVDFGAMEVTVAVNAINNDGNSAISVGDALYYVDADTPNISKKTTDGYFFGFAMEAVTSGEEAEIRVLKTQAGISVATTTDLVTTAVETKAISVAVPGASAGDATAVLYPLFVADDDIEVTAINFIPAAAQAGQNTNTATLAVRNVGDGAAGTDDLMTFAQTNSNDLAANVPADFGSALANEAVSAGDVLVWHRTLTSSGVASPAGVVVIEYTVQEA
jgi:hypothetical protein